MDNKVCFIRLLTGDDLIAEIISNTKTKMTIKNPMLILNNIEIEEGRQTLILYPWIPQGIALGNTSEIRAINVLMINEIEPEILEYYNGIVEHAFSNKPKMVSVNGTKPAESGKILAFPDNSSKNKKDLN